jgi:hypothetical protein
MVFAPKGLQDSAQGFNPGNLKINEFALKGREADKINLAPIAARAAPSASGESLWVAIPRVEA